MFLNLQNKEQTQYYYEMLKTVASLSGLFSESSAPYIQYRVAENLFCKSFSANNHARADSSVDASTGDIGIGIKTFLNKNGKTMQKIAEFNTDHSLFKGLKLQEKAKKIAELRNARLEFTKRSLNLNKLIYHCITRDKNKIYIYETSMDYINIKRIRKVKDKGTGIEFSDGLNDYSFNDSKSTLYKRFVTPDTKITLPTKVLDDPFDTLKLLFDKLSPNTFLSKHENPHVFLPLYSIEKGKKVVAEKSGLNQWNAKGRLNRKTGKISSRNFDEAYIQIPAWIHKLFPDFFPGIEQSFDLALPNGEKMSAKVCQQNSKALFSNPNPKLGNWILRTVLNLKEGELLTYEKLQEVGIDSVVLYKISNENYDIDFTKIGSYETFKEENKS